MKVYLAQPMAGLSEQQIANVRRRAEKEIKRNHENTNVVILNSYNPEWADIPAKEALVKSLDWLIKADAAYFAPGWQDSHGCRVEWDFCEEYCIPHAELQIPGYV